LKNNIFEIATKELSQDAFIHWLLKFAKIEHGKENEALSKCAKELLTYITGEKNPVVITIESQYKNIDILVVVNDSINIIIEDKTFSGTHGNQIERYKKILEGEKREIVITVYYKIVEQANKENVDIHIDRKYLLNLFSKYVKKANNQIFCDYYDYLKFIDDDVNAYKTTQIADWRNKHNHVYRGFFTNLIDNEYINKTKEYSWSFVNNGSGGFWGLWWYGLTSEELNYCGLADYGIDSLYLQIEDKNIALKMTGDNSYKKEVRWKIYNYFSKEVVGYRKKAFRKGKHMSVGYIEYNEKNYAEKIKIMEKAVESIIQCKSCF